MKSEKISFKSNIWNLWRGTKTRQKLKGNLLLKEKCNEWDLQICSFFCLWKWQKIHSTVSCWGGKYRVQAGRIIRQLGGNSGKEATTKGISPQCACSSSHKTWLSTKFYAIPEEDHRVLQSTRGKHKFKFESSQSLTAF